MTQIHRHSPQIPEAGDSGLALVLTLPPLQPFLNLLNSLIVLNSPSFLNKISFFAQVTSNWFLLLAIKGNLPNMGTEVLRSFSKITQLVSD